MIWLVLNLPSYHILSSYWYNSRLFIHLFAQKIFSEGLQHATQPTGWCVGTQWWIQIDKTDYQHLISSPLVTAV